MYTVEPEITSFARFLNHHRGETHNLIFDNTQEFIYGYREISPQTYDIIEDDFFDGPTEPMPDSVSSPDALPSSTDVDVQ